MLRQWIAMGVVVVSSSAPLTAQPPRLGSEWGVSIWSGYSFDSRGPLGWVSGRDFVVVGVRFTHSLVDLGRTELRYAADVIPFAWATNVPNADLTRIPDKLGGFVAASDSTGVPGVGVSPLGVEFFPYRGWVLEPFLTATAGVLTFTKPVPFRNARKLNLTFDIGWGLVVRPGASTEMALGFRIHHLSNAGTAPANPGLDARIWFVSVKIR